MRKAWFLFKKGSLLKRLLVYVRKELRTIWWAFVKWVEIRGLKKGNPRARLRGLGSRPSV
jgi:hypothetical protein